MAVEADSGIDSSPETYLPVRRRAADTARSVGNDGPEVRERKLVLRFCGHVKHHSPVSVRRVSPKVKTGDGRTDGHSGRSRVDSSDRVSTAMGYSLHGLLALPHYMFDSVLNTSPIYVVAGGVLMIPRV